MSLCGHQEPFIDCRMCWTTLLATNERLRAESRMLAQVADRMREHEKKLDAVAKAALALDTSGISHRVCAHALKAALDALKEGA